MLLDAAVGRPWDAQDLADAHDASRIFEQARAQCTQEIRAVPHKDRSKCGPLGYWMEPGQDLLDFILQHHPGSTVALMLSNVHAL